MTPSRQRSDGRSRYSADRIWLVTAVHELPVGVLWGVDAATPAQCTEVLDGLDEFADLCDRLGLDDHKELIEGCRWHFDHYSHYLGRRRHFVDYPTYIRDRHGPEQVAPPPAPDWLRRCGEVARRRNPMEFRFNV